MASVRGVCSSCGAQLAVDAVGPFTEAALVAPLCPVCADRVVLDQGGVALTLSQELPGALFPLGRVTVTAGAVAALAEAGEHAVALLWRHAAGDWGEVGHADEIELSEEEWRLGWEVTDDTGKVNRSNLLAGRGSLMSEYRMRRGQRLWVITLLDRGGGTTVLLPDEH